MPSKPAGNSNQTTTSNSTQQVTLPDWVNNAAQSIWGKAQDVSQNLQPAVASLTGQQNDLINALISNAGYGSQQFAQAQNGAQGAINYKPDQVTPGLLSQTDLSPYMNPYTQAVIDPSMKLLDQQRQQANNQTADLAAKTGAFGGSRQGVSEGVTNAQSALLGGQLGAQLNAANFSNAQQQAQQDLARSLQGQALNQQAGLQGAGLNLQGATALGNLTQQASGSTIAQTMAALQGAGLTQQNQQEQMTAGQQNPINQLQVLLAAIGGVPYGHTQTGTQSQTGMGPTENPTLTALGGLSSLAGTAGSLATIFSDRRMKTDIKKLGEDLVEGIPLYAYRYKGDPKSYPKVVGPMAQDIERKYPDLVHEIGGKKVVGLLGAY